jgi:hypothetical protein
MLFFLFLLGNLKMRRAAAGRLTLTAAKSRRCSMVSGTKHRTPALV